MLLSKTLVLAAMLPTTATASAQTQRWEYGLLTANIGLTPAKSGFSWEAGGLVDFGPGSTAALLKRIAGAEYASLKNPSTSTALLNDLGPQGWEKVGATATRANEVAGPGHGVKRRGQPGPATSNSYPYYSCCRSRLLHLLTRFEEQSAVTYSPL